MTALSLAVATLTACATWGTGSTLTVADAPPETLEVTVINHHPQALRASLSMRGAMWYLGTVEPGEQRRFELPPDARERSSYYLLGDCDSGERIASEVIAAGAAEEPHFVMSRTSLDSWVRYPRTIRTVTRR